MVAEIRHHVRGRIRLRISAARRVPALLESIRQRLVQTPGVRSIQVNPAAAGMVIEYDPAMYGEFPMTLAQVGERENLFRLEQSNSNGSESMRSRADRALDDGFGRLNRAVQGSTGNLVGMKEMLPAGIALSALFLVDRAAAAAQWLSWIQFAWSSWFDLHQNDPVHDVAVQIRDLHAEIAAVRQLLEHRMKSEA